MVITISHIQHDRIKQVKLFIQISLSNLLSAADVMGIGQWNEKLLISNSLPLHRPKVDNLDLPTLYIIRDSVNNHYRLFFSQNDEIRTRECSQNEILQSQYQSIVLLLENIASSFTMRYLKYFKNEFWVAEYLDQTVDKKHYVLIK